MTNNVNISDFEKLIFISNIDEQDIGQKEIITNSSNYNFAVFFSKSPNRPANWNYVNNPINIWHKGQRLNRFIGVADNSSININGHIFNLIFNYDTGLLSISDTSILQSIKLTSVSYIDVQTNSIPNINVDSKDFIINSIDNTFSLTYLFRFDNSVKASEQKPTLNIDNDNKENKFFELLSTEKNIQSQSEFVNNEISYTYTFRYFQDTNISQNQGVNFVNQRFTAYSPNNDNLLDSIRLRLILNPVKLNILDADNNFAGDKSFSGIVSPVLKTYKISISPYITGSYYGYPRTYSEHDIYVKVETDYPNVVSLNNSTNTNKVEYYSLDNSVIDLNLWVHPGQVNSQSNAIIKCKLVWRNTTGDYVDMINPDCKYKDFTISTKGLEDKLYYYGYINPTSNTFNYNLMKSYKDLGKYALLYDYDGTNIGKELEDNINNKFYFAVPNDENINIKYDVYVLDGNFKVYNSISSARDHIFNIIAENYEILGTKYIIYESTDNFKGKWYGKLQKDY